MTIDFEAARQHMVDSQVRCNAVTDLSVQRALLTVPKESFLPSALKDQAYVERELIDERGRSIVTARDLSKLLAVIELKPTDLVLEFGSIQGYVAALAAQMADMVVAIEPDETRSEQIQAIFDQQGIDNAVVIGGALREGSAKQGPYDAILLAEPVEQIPDTLFAQLKDGGRLATLQIKDGVPRGVIYVRAGETITARVDFDGSCRQILDGFEKPKEFSF
ncbi:MAG: protein-L-isoaspartate O-methyltransferase [Pseudomonadota bacterium]